MIKEITSIDFWNKSSIIETQNKTTSWEFYFEDYLIELAIKSVDRPINSVHIIGVGTGREIFLIKKYFPEAKIIGSDFAEKMIEKCKENCQGDEYKNVEIVCEDVTVYSPSKNSIDLVVVFNNVFNYITPREKLIQALKLIDFQLKNDGIIIGVVHNQFGKITKSSFFLLQRVLKFLKLTRLNVGDRFVSYKNMDEKFITHYFSKKELDSIFSKYTNLKKIELIDINTLNDKLDKKKKYNSFNNILYCYRK